MVMLPCFTAAQVHCAGVQQRCPYTLLSCQIGSLLVSLAHASLLLLFLRCDMNARQPQVQMNRGAVDKQRGWESPMVASHLARAHPLF